jgi:hypothetical protein
MSKGFAIKSSAPASMADKLNVLLADVSNDQRFF